MKNFKFYLSCVAVLCLLFTSCSKEEAVTEDPDAKATLSFATVLNDLADKKSAVKQSLDDLPECSDAAPAYVAVVLSGEETVGTEQDPIIVPVNPTPGDFDGEGEAYFTEESGDLELTPGTYQLEYFVVYDGDPADESSNIIWVAPRNDGGLSGFVGATLPMTIELGAGAKKYADVEVLCFDNRMVNEYGYLFFDIEGTEAIEFCIFGNFCDDGGRHFPAAYSVDIWAYADGTRGDQIYSDWQSEVVLDENGDYAAEPICFALPDSEGLDEYYIEITLLDSDAYDTEERVIRSGVISDADVTELFDGDANLDYYHFREGCEGEDFPALLDGDGNGDGNGDDNGDDNGDGNGDGNGDDNGDGNGNGNLNLPDLAEGCNHSFLVETEDEDGFSPAGDWGWAEYIGPGEADFPFSLEVDGEEIGTIGVELSGGNVTVTINPEVTRELLIENVHINISAEEPEAELPADYSNTFTVNETGFEEVLTGVELDAEGGFWIIVHAEVCPQ